MTVTFTPYFVLFIKKGQLIILTVRKKTIKKPPAHWCPAWGKHFTLQPAAFPLYPYYLILQIFPCLKRSFHPI